MISMTNQIEVLNSNIIKLRSMISRSESEDRQLSDYYREILRMYHDSCATGLFDETISVNTSRDRLQLLAHEAVLFLGGGIDPQAVSLKNYDHEKYGPFLGVSDEGSAADVICKAALLSPKMQVIGPAKPIIVGVSHDAERLGSVGEVPVGPDEYANIFLNYFSAY
jgi:hypothetical protein